MTQVPTFNRSLLHPRYLTWVGIGLLYLLVLLPYPVIYWLGTSIGRFAMRSSAASLSPNATSSSVFPTCRRPNAMRWW